MAGMSGGEAEVPLDNAETITISSLALLKMLKHGRAGVPLEVSLLFAIQGLGLDSRLPGHGSHAGVRISQRLGRSSISDFTII